MTSTTCASLVKVQVMTVDAECALHHCGGGAHGLIHHAGDAGHGLTGAMALKVQYI